MRSKSLLAGAVVLLASVAVPAAADAVVCNGAQLRLGSGNISPCYGPGTHGINDQKTTSIEVADGYQATLHTRGGGPKTYYPGKHITDTNTATKIVVVKF
ncbi:hypothetical protein [Allokutzneria sp. NRRL B-24872]|uniref:hypothetical protein n=1 Tax=Allokutzneria sp. NRRL B-24872 TaxID=1137961 RepID=UPI000A37A428|nr:hypothetical protein [Allokutzneria sp. NRRL B-24872]